MPTHAVLLSVITRTKLTQMVVADSLPADNFSGPANCDQKLVFIPSCCIGRVGEGDEKNNYHPMPSL